MQNLQKQASGTHSSRLLSVRHIRKQFGYRDVLTGVDLDLDSGVITLLMGKNGAGKSTLVKILSGLMKPSSGEITFKGMPVGDCAGAYRAAFGLITHQALFYDDLSARENLLFFGKLRKTPNLNSKTDQVLKTTGLERARDVQVKAFSTGMVKRLNIARLMLSSPEILFLDEPYSGLDLDSIQLLNDYITSFKQQGGTVLIISHQLDCCFDVCDTACILVNGKIGLPLSMASMSPEELIALYQDEVMAGEL